MVKDDQWQGENDIRFTPRTEGQWFRAFSLN